MLVGHLGAGMTDKFLEGRVAVVTGAARGLGRATALALGGAGARLALADCEPVDATLEAAAGQGIEACGWRIDVSDEADVGRLADGVRERYGRADILVNIAGIVIRKRVSELTLAEWNRVIGVNLTGAFLTCRALVPLMKGRGYGRIINTASVMAHVSSPDRPSYSASKFGILGLTKSLAADLAGEGITAVSISPGAFATGMTAGLLRDPERNAALMARTPVKRLGRPEEIAALVLFLCSEGAGFVTGTDIVIDGGWLAQ